jgi:hypothetical protein
MSQPSLVERLNASIELLRVCLKEYELLDETTKKSVRHQLYVKTGGFGKALFHETKCLAADYTVLEQKLGMAAFVPDKVTVRTIDGKIVLEGLPGWMSYEVISND